MRSGETGKHRLAHRWGRRDAELRKERRRDKVQFHGLFEQTVLGRWPVHPQETVRMVHAALDPFDFVKNREEVLAPMLTWLSVSKRADGATTVVMGHQAKI